MALALSWLQLAPEEFVVEPTLMVIGLNHRTAPLAMRERFWIGENRRYEVLRLLKSAEGVEEIIVVSTRCRTEFLLWASEPTLAANSLLQYLTKEHGLKLSEWEHFYRLLDEAVLTHVFRLACGLDCQMLCSPDVVANLTAAWEQARTVGAAGRSLNSLMEEALRVSGKVRQENKVSDSRVCIATASRDLAEHVFGSLEKRKVLLLGTGIAAENSARLMLEGGAGPLVVIDQNPLLAQETARKLGATAATQTDRWGSLVKADIVISATGCSHFVLTREEAERIASERNRVALLILDINLPRDVDPEVRRVDGILLYDLDGLERTAARPVAERTAAVVEIENMVVAEVQAFRSRMQTQMVAPTTVALRQRLDEICRQELESFIDERGPFTREQDQSLHAITAQIIQKIASSLARELKELPEREEQEQMTAVVTRLFHLESPQRALAGTRSERNDDKRKQQGVAIHY
ncbi:MAG TPA: glutamyl-tRNA reductase [Candidatus Dormibacteraeota bacterium]|nr:glutamyl-tRNA reductase [Candidatus Dormibacteraeota bacterium]